MIFDTNKPLFWIVIVFTISMTVLSVICGINAVTEINRINSVIDDMDCFELWISVKTGEYSWSVYENKVKDRLFNCQFVYPHEWKIDVMDKLLGEHYVPSYYSKYHPFNHDYNHVFEFTNDLMYVEHRLLENYKVHEDVFAHARKNIHNWDEVFVRDMVTSISSSPEMKSTMSELNDKFGHERMAEIIYELSEMHEPVKEKGRFNND